ncbi:hypothetical protein GCM10022207_75620 [Streptomyces lannensis]|uniref:Uncharacterized protein n=1 Tax=Streptomyces lannensis TaxID=766498 RepID=A0ABP7L779_9ACTN
MPTAPNSAPEVSATAAAPRAAARLNLSVISHVLSERRCVKLRQLARSGAAGLELILSGRHAENGKDART